MRYIVVALLFCQLLFARELVVVGNSNFPKQTLSLQEVQSIFLSKKRFIDGKRVLVMNFEVNSSLRRCFEKHILKKSQASLERYWRKAYYQGKRPPKIVTSKEMLFLYLQTVQPSIGYVDANATSNREVKVLYRVGCD